MIEKFLGWLSDNIVVLYVVITIIGIISLILVMSNIVSITISWILVGIFGTMVTLSFIVTFFKERR